MKKLTIIIFTLLFILTSCSNLEDTKKAELENKEMCYKYKEQIQKEIDKSLIKLWWETWKWLWEIFYSKKENACFYHDIWMWSIVNLFENKTIFYWWEDKEKIQNKIQELKN